MIVLGIDPGTAVTGYGVVQEERGAPPRLLECGVIRTLANAPLPHRLRNIFEGVGALLERHKPDVVAVEGVFFGRNARSAMVLGHARGVILLAASIHGLDVAEYPPAEVKNAVVGTGRATKEQVGFMTQKLLRLREPPKPADAADGVAIALCHCFRSRSGRGSSSFPLPAAVAPVTR
ncbi:MAG: crossover junction endodeoxyribonuclease RuvC [Gemmatimonadota bacterium]|nr:crossover junction endodeoxyribonuclease RuvC [Gemmatimonadota bacterium]